MSPTSQSLRELFEAALELSPDERPAFLASICSDSALRARVEALLAADAIAGEPASAAVVDGLARAIGDSASELSSVSFADGIIGSFTLLDVIGEGGSSTVFHARREIEGAVQNVALKLLRRSLHSPEGQRQFRREQSALIQLQHPNIAHMIEGGVTPTGLPFIALELIEGKPINEFAIEQRLGLRERLKLFLSVCAAVDAAHRLLIVHRDLKPSNVLVDVDGEVKLLDFGIAKLLAEDDEGQRTVLPAFTPAYAAPEQHDGGTVTTATDVYSLGVLLGELATGSRPNDGDDRLPSSRLGDSTGNSTGSTQSTITRRQVRGDLDSIVLKALESEPSRRYASAGALADDIRRMLDGQPVSAHPPTRWYRTSKFVQRHKGGVVITIAFMLATFAALGIALWQAREARREAVRANAVTEFVESMFEPIRRGVSSGKQPSLAELVDQGAARIDTTETLGPAERVKLLLMFSRLNDYLSQQDQYQALANRAGELADSALGPDSPLALDALVARGTAALRRSDFESAGLYLVEAEKRFRSSRTAGDSWIRLLGTLGQWAGDTGDNQRSLEYSVEALAARIIGYGDESKEADGGRVNLAVSYEGVGRFSEAVSLYQSIYPRYVSRYGVDSAHTVAMRGRIGQAELMAGHTRLGRDELLGALAALSNPEGGASSYQVKLSQSLCLADAMVSLESALGSCAQSVAFAELAEGADGPNVGRALHVQGMMLIEQGYPNEAQAVLERANRILADADRTNWQGRAEIALGEIALIRSRHAEAAALLVRGIKNVGMSYPPYLHAYGRALAELACTLDETAADCAEIERGSGARAIAAQATPWNPLLLAANIAVARVDLVHGNDSAAISRLEQALSQASGELDPDTPRQLEARLWLVTAHALSGACNMAASELETIEPALALHYDHALIQAPLLAASSGRACPNLLD